MKRLSKPRELYNHRNGINGLTTRRTIETILTYGSTRLYQVYKDPQSCSFMDSSMYLPRIAYQTGITQISLQRRRIQGGIHAARRITHKYAFTQCVWHLYHVCQYLASITTVSVSNAPG